MVEQFHLSERRACRLVGLARDSYRHPPQESELNQQLSVKIVEIAHARRRFGYPLAVRTDNGPEFTSRAFMGWAHKHRIRHILIEPGRPMQNGYIESFNGKFRDECLNEHWFQTLAQARAVIGE